MVRLIAQLTDVHIGGPQPDNGERFSAAVDEINRMTRQPDLVLLTGDLTHNGAPAEWRELTDRLAQLEAPFHAIAGNHDQGIDELAGHRTLDLDPLHLVLLDTSSNEVSPDDASWLDQRLTQASDRPVVIAMHHPPFETGIWWMDCVGLKHASRIEAVVRRHPQVIKVLAGHVHRPIQSAWGPCSLWACPATSVAIAPDLDPDHAPAETAEPPSFSLHAYTNDGAMVTHVVPVGPAAARSAIGAVAPEFVGWARQVQRDRPSTFT